jgi:trehalose 6-phosphate synthase
MPRAERRKRMKSLRKRVRENDVSHWSETFLAALDAAHSGASLENPLGGLEWTSERPMRRRR